MLVHAAIPASSNRLMLSYPHHPIELRMQESGVQIPPATKSIGRKPSVANQPYTAAAEENSDDLQA